MLCKAQNNFDKAGFYESISGTDTNKINSELNRLANIEFPQKEAYSGALLMKKSGLLKGASRKLSIFKSGNKMLEAAIKKNSSDIELHFLRLMIQENAPGILGYNNDIPTDSEMIKNHYKELSKVVQQAIFDYSKKSKSLKPSDFN